MTKQIIAIFLIGIVVIFGSGCIDIPTQMSDPKYTLIVDFELTVNPSAFGMTTQDLMPEPQRFDFLTEEEVKRLVDQVNNLNKTWYGHYTYEIREM